MKEKDNGSIHGDWGDDFAGEVLLFGLLGKILYTFPEKSWLDPILDEDLFVEAPFAKDHLDVVEGLSLLMDFSHKYASRNKDAILEDLKSEYTRLFDHTVRIPVAPWESVYLSKDHLLFQEQVLEVRNWYRTFGLELVKIHQEPDDHIGLELAFLAHMANLALQAIENGNQDELDRILDAKRRFLTEHVFRWVPTWCDLMLEYGKTDFYKGVTLVLRGALEELAERLGLDRPVGLVE